MGCGASVEADDGGWGKSDSEVRGGVFTGTRARARVAAAPPTTHTRARARRACPLVPRRWRAHTTSHAMTRPRHAVDAPRHRRDRTTVDTIPHPLRSRSLTQSCAAESRKIKLLILGAGESGKSTLFKQMKILYGTPFTSEEAIYIKAVIHENVLEAMQTLITNLENFDETRGLEVGCQDALELVRAAEVDEPIDEEPGNALQALWKDPAIQAMWKLRGRVQLVESVVYFFNKLDEIGKDDWVPSNQDILAGSC